jgi:photosystem II stability/assembly factor-like uncharacterized protein
MSAWPCRLAPVALLCLFAAAAGTARSDDEPKGGPPEFRGRLKYRNIGPAAGGRVCRACGVPGDPLTYYAATAAGGVWKSADGGLHWKPVFDEQPASSIGSIAVAPSDSNVVYVGTGEANIRGNVQAGNGIYKSTDAGKTWKHVWKHEGQIGTMLVHPTNPDVAYAAVLGHAFGPNEERGVYRTTDGGKTWQRVLFKDKDTGASDVCFDPSNPRVLYAGLWQARRRPWDMTSGGPGSGLWTSRDGGDTWTQLVAAPADVHEPPAEQPPGKRVCPGLPEGIWGKVGVAVSPSDPNRVYALIEAEKGGLFRSNDGGKTWSVANGHHALRQRAWYYTTFTVDPTNADVLWFPQVALYKSIDGGKSLLRVKGPHHGDHHDVWIDPKDPRRMIDSNDGGVDISTNGGQTWTAPPLPISQFYHIAVDARTPYHVSGTMQDLGTASGPSNSLIGVGVRLSDWHPVGGGETGFTAPDPSDPNVVYAGEYGGYLSRYDHRTRQARSVGVYPFNPSGHGAEDLLYRFQWTAPVLVSRHDPKVVYHAANVLFKTTDAGANWSPVSPDLTRNDKSKQKWAGGPITGDNTGVEVYGTIFALAESPKLKGLLWAGTDDGLVQVSEDGGAAWTNVTANVKGLPEWATILCVEASPFEADTAYLVADAHKLDDMRPYLWKTEDRGKTWKSLTAGLPNDVPVRVVREDPKRKGLLYAGTERGMLLSRDGGATWTDLRLNLPTVAVTDLVVHGDDLVVGTNGRSVWILDDLTPVREWSADVPAKSLYLFPARAATRYRYGPGLGERMQPGTFPNPPNGAVLHYFLKEKPKGDVVIEILDAQGGTVETLTSKEDPADKDLDPLEDDEEALKKLVLPKEPGLHRIVWNLRYHGAKTIRRAKVDTGHPKVGPLAAPGAYTVKLTVGGQTVQTPLTVTPDPRTAAMLAHLSLEEQQRYALKVRDDIGRVTRAVEQIRAVRQQIVAHNELLKDDPRAGSLVKASQPLLPKLDELEGKLHNPKAEVVYDILAQKGGAQLYSQLGMLFELIKDSDGAPNQGWRNVYAEQSKLLDQLEARWRDLVGGPLAKLNETAKGLDLPVVIVPPLPDRPKNISAE